MNKKDLRKSFIKKRDSLTHKEIRRISDTMFNQLYSLPIYKHASTIMSYVSINKEIFTHHFIKNSIKNGKKIYIPVTRPSTKKLALFRVIDFEHDLEKGYWGLFQPKKETFRPQSYKLLDLILVPGLAFTKEGHRLGYGGGYYDAFLSSLTKPVPTLAIAFEFQILEALPIQSHDVPVDYILTQEKLIHCKDYRK